MSSESLIQLALNALKCNQKELSMRIGVSPTQISKWKKGEHMSADMENELRILAGIGDKDPNFVLSTGSLANAQKWESLVKHLAGLAYNDAETGYNTVPLEDEEGLLCSNLFDLLHEIGVGFPSEFPSELDFDYQNDEQDEMGQLLEHNIYVQVIDEIFSSLNDVYGFYAAYISELVWDEKLSLFDTPAVNIEPCLLSLAASKIEKKNLFTPKFKNFKCKIEKKYVEWLLLVKDRAFRAGVPLRVEILNLVYSSNGDLGNDAEAESLGFNATRLHPDIYMNELLVGMRVIHQVLPAILKKLGIEDDFKLDTSDLTLHKD